MRFGTRGTMGVDYEQRIDFRRLHRERVEKIHEELEKTADGYRITEITINPKDLVKDASAEDRTKRILEKAEKHCLISNSMLSEIKVVPEVALKK